LQKTLQKGDTVLDPGANLGFITALAADLVGNSGKGFAFEPSITCFEKLTRLNPAPPPQVELIHAAISDRTGKDTFYDTPRVVSRGYSALGSVSLPADGVPYEIPTWSLDDFTAQRGLGQIRLIKLDVEGAGLPALKGAKRILEERKADFILVETTQNDTQRSLNREIAALLSPGYAPFDIRQDGSLNPFDLEAQASYRLDVMWKRKGA
jgi:FkbM family methyltransferase